MRLRWRKSTKFPKFSRDYDSSRSRSRDGVSKARCVLKDTRLFEISTGFTRYGVCAILLSRYRRNVNSIDIELGEHWFYMTQMFAERRTCVYNIRYKAKTSNVAERHDVFSRLEYTFIVFHGQLCAKVYTGHFACKAQLFNRVSSRKLATLSYICICKCDEISSISFYLIIL